MLLLCFSVCKRNKAFLPEFVLFMFTLQHNKGYFDQKALLWDCMVNEITVQWAKVSDSAYELTNTLSYSVPRLHSSFESL